MTFWTNRGWFFHSWDRAVLPKPFARVIIRYGQPLRVHRESGTDQTEALRERLEKEMNYELETIQAAFKKESGL